MFVPVRTHCGAKINFASHLCSRGALIRLNCCYFSVLRYDRRRLYKQFKLWSIWPYINIKRGSAVMARHLSSHGLHAAPVTACRRYGPPLGRLGRPPELLWLIRARLVCVYQIKLYHLLHFFKQLIPLMSWTRHYCWPKLKWWEVYIIPKGCSHCVRYFFNWWYNSWILIHHIFSCTVRCQYPCQ